MKKNNSGLTQTKVAMMPEVPSQVPSKQPSYQAVVGLDVSDRRTLSHRATLRLAPLGLDAGKLY